MRGQATKHSEASKTNSCWHQDAHQVCNTSPTTKASRAHHQKGSLEALKMGDKGGNNTLSKACEPYK